MVKVNVSSEIGAVCPGFVGACVEAHVLNTPYNEALWEEIHALSAHYREELTTETLKQLPAIEATRRIYRALHRDESQAKPPDREPEELAACPASCGTPDSRSL